MFLKTSWSPIEKVSLRSFGFENFLQKVSERLVLHPDIKAAMLGE
jgi:hypothetical protein